MDISSGCKFWVFILWCFQLENEKEGTLLDVATGCERMGREWGMTCTEATTGGSL